MTGAATRDAISKSSGRLKHASRFERRLQQTIPLERREHPFIKAGSNYFFLALFAQQPLVDTRSKTVQTIRAVLRKWCS
jgi:hypothetical protein